MKKLKLTELTGNTGQIDGVPANPRQINKDDYQKLITSLQEDSEFMEHKPLHVYKQGEKYIVLGGNMRLRALRELEWKEVPVTIYKPETPPDVLRARVIKDNSSFGDYDMGALANEWGEYELDDWGVDIPDDWLNQEEVVEDEAPEVDEKEPAKSKRGEVYQLGAHRVMCGDSTVKENVEKLMNGEKADMVFTDPPYGVSYQSNMRTKTEKFDVIKNDDVIDARAIDLAYDYSTGWVLVCTGWTVLTKWLEIINDEITNLIVWDKGGGGMGDLKRSLSTDYELIMAYNRGNEIVGKRLGSVWRIGKDFAGSYAHPTQKPVELPAQAIKTFSTGSILDLFLGSGSTLIAAEQTGRVCYGMELDEKYTDVVRKRWAKFISPTDEVPENWEELTPAIKESK